MTESHVTLITGGGSGIGAATARKLLEQGKQVTITGRGENRLRQFAANAGRPAGLLTIAGDAADYDSVESAVEATVEKFGRLDAVVASAGYATENTRRMVTGDGVGVTLINPGATATNFFNADGGLPDRAMMTADELASSIVWAIGQPSGVDINTMTIRPVGSPL